MLQLQSIIGCQLERIYFSLSTGLSVQWQPLYSCLSKPGHTSGNYISGLPKRQREFTRPVNTLLVEVSKTLIMAEHFHAPKTRLKKNLVKGDAVLSRYLVIH